MGHGPKAPRVHVAGLDSCTVQLTEREHREANMGKKSTHAGTCQSCLRMYKLNPNGDALVLHGYTRPGWGSVQGECSGAHRLPYELDCELVKSIAKNVEESLRGMRLRRDDWASAKSIHRVRPTKDGVAKYRESQPRWSDWWTHRDVDFDTTTIKKFHGKAVDELLAEGSVEVTDLPVGPGQWEGNGAVENALRRLDMYISSYEHELNVRNKLIKDWEVRPLKTVDLIDLQVYVEPLVNGRLKLVRAKTKVDVTTNRKTVIFASRSEAEKFAKDNGLHLVDGDSKIVANMGHKTEFDQRDC